MPTYTYLSDLELVHMLAEHRSRSPVIEELCARIENNPNNYQEADSELSTTLHCPVCDASLSVECTIEDEGKGSISWEIR